MKFVPLLILQFLILTGIAQQNPSHWIQKPSTTISFTENLGMHASILNEEIKFYSRSNGITYFFSNKSFIIGRQNQLAEEELHERQEKMERGEDVAPITWNYFKIEFENAHPLSEIYGENKMHHTSHFQDKQHPLITKKAKNYKQLTYVNLYPNIDMVLTLPEEGGFKYSFLVKPGGDYKDIKMQYENATIKKDAHGGLLIESNFGSFTDQPPFTTVEENTIQSNFDLNENSVSFNINSYDSAKTLIIDPWINLETSTVDDLFLSEFGRYLELEITADNYGNCLILREWGSRMSLYNNAGILQWEWANYGGGPGDLTCNPVLSEFYFEGFANIVKLNIDGDLLASYTSSAEDPQEMFRSKYSPVIDKLVVGLGGVNPDEDHISFFNTDLSSRVNYTILDSPFSLAEDVTLLDLDPEDGAIYFLTPDNLPDLTVYGNILYKVDPLDPTTIIWQTNTDHSFLELLNLKGYNSVNAFNGIACGFDYVYTYDANKLNQFDKNTGNLIDFLEFGKEPLSIHGGIDTDSCDNVFIGTSDSILIFNNELEFLQGYALPDSCCDLVVSDNWIYASGKDFVTGIEIDADLCNAPIIDDNNEEEEEEEENNEPIIAYLDVPNIFTPNSDGINDLLTFKYLSEGINSFHCVILNRWGITVAELNNIEDGWDGENGNGTLCTTGTYFYKYEATTVSGAVIRGQGNVQLIRK